MCWCMCSPGSPCEVNQDLPQSVDGLNGLNFSPGPTNVHIKTSADVVVTKQRISLTLHAERKSL